MTLLLAIVLVVWSAVNTFLSITAILGGFNNHKDIEALESWKIISQIKIPKDDGKGGAE